MGEVDGGNKNNGRQPVYGGDTEPSTNDICSICLYPFTNTKTLDKCGHSFCTECIDEAFKVKKQCPTCYLVYGPLIGNQPEGEMIVNYTSRGRLCLPGYEECRGTIIINYKFPDGIQGPDHPNPGKPYKGKPQDAFLPKNKEGQKVLKLLKKAFDQKLTFTIGSSETMDMEDVVLFADIPHKTTQKGGSTRNGYPDPDYLTKVQEVLAAKGIR